LGQPKKKGQGTQGVKGEWAISTLGW